MLLFRSLNVFSVFSDLVLKNPVNYLYPPLLVSFQKQIFSEKTTYPNFFSHNNSTMLRNNVTITLQKTYLSVFQKKKGMLLWLSNVVFEANKWRKHTASTNKLKWKQGEEKVDVSLKNPMVISLKDWLRVPVGFWSDCGRVKCPFFF